MKVKDLVGVMFDGTIIVENPITGKRHKYKEYDPIPDEVMEASVRFFYAYDADVIVIMTDDVFGRK